MERQKISLGKISKEETLLIEPSIERIAGLEELILIIDDYNMRQKIMLEIESLREQCNTWWSCICKKYNWINIDICDWEINTITNEININKLV